MFLLVRVFVIGHISTCSCLKFVDFSQNYIDVLAGRSKRYREPPVAGPSAIVLVTSYCFALYSNS